VVLALLVRRGIHIGLHQAAAEPLHHGYDLVVDGGGLRLCHQAGGRCLLDLLCLLNEEGAEGTQALGGGGQ